MGILEANDGVDESHYKKISLFLPDRKLICQQNSLSQFAWSYRRRSTIGNWSSSFATRNFCFWDSGAKRAFYDVPVRIMNTTQNPVCLYGGRNVTELQVITVIGPLIQRDKTALYCRTTKDSTKRQEEVPEHIEKLIEAVHPSVPECLGFCKCSRTLELQNRSWVTKVLSLRASCSKTS